MRARLLLLLLFFLCLRPHALLAARLELRAAATGATVTSVQVGEQIQVELWVDSESQALSGAAVFLSYDDSVFELIDPAGRPLQGDLRPFSPGSFLGNGEVFRNDRLAEDDPAATAPGCQLDYSVVRATDQGNGAVASLRLRAVAPARSARVAIDETGIRETRVFLPDGSQAPFRFITPLSVTVQGIRLEGLPERLVLPRGSDGIVMRLNDLVSDPLYTAQQITWTHSPTATLTVSRDPFDNLLTIIPPAGQSVWEQLVLTATNPDGQSASDTLDVFVAAPPSLRAPDEAVDLLEDVPLDLALDPLVDDADTPASQLAWSATGSPGLAVAIAGPPFAARVTPAAEWSGSGWITLTVTDEYGFADTLQVPVRVAPVNDPPRMLMSPNVRLTEGRQDSSLSVAQLTADVEDGVPSLSWQAAEHVALEQRGGRLILSSDAGWTGSEQISLLATDSGGLTAGAPLTVTVVPSLPPSIVDAPARRGMAAGSSFSLTLDGLVVDPDDARSQLLWRVSGQQQLRVLLSTARTARVEAPTDFAGIEILTFTATDPAGGAASFDLVVFAAPVTGEPLFAPLPSLRLPVDGVDASIDLDEYVYDLDHEPAQIEFLLPARDDVMLTVDPLSHVLSIAPGAAAIPGTLQLEVRALDPDGHEATAILHLELVASVAPRPFSLSLPSSVQVTVGEPLVLALDGYVAGDVNPAAVSWSADADADLSLQLDGSQRRLTVTAGEGSVGDLSLSLTARLDGESLDGSLTVRVQAVPEVTPQLLSLPSLTLTAGRGPASLALGDYLVGIQPGDLQWSTTTPDHVSIGFDAGTGELVITATEGWSGREDLVLIAEDGDGLRLESALIIDVLTPAAVLSLTEVSETAVLAGTTEIRLALDGLLDTDADPAELEWNAEAARALTVTVDPETGELVLRAQSPWTASEIVTLRVTDGAAAVSGRLLVQVFPTDGSAGEESVDFALAVVPHPLQPDYVDVYVVSALPLEQSPLVRLRDGVWSDVFVAEIAAGLWTGQHVLSPGWQQPVELVALSIDPSRRLLRSSWTLEPNAAPAASRMAPAARTASPTPANGDLIDVAAGTVRSLPGKRAR